MNPSIAQPKIVNAQRVSALLAQPNSPLNKYVESLAKTLFEQTHLIWTQQEVDKHWVDPEYQAEIRQYRYLAQISLDFLFHVGNVGAKEV